MHIKNLLKGSSLFLAIAVTIIIALLSLMKIGKIPIDFTYTDKVGHCIAYAVLSFFWMLAIGKVQRAILIIIVLCILYGIILEVFQGMTNYRTFDFVDMGANTIGVLIGFLFFIFFTKKENLTD